MPSRATVYVGDDFEYEVEFDQANKFFSVNGQRIATLATWYTPPSSVWQRHWAWRWIGKPLAPLAVPVVALAMLLALASVVAMGAGVRRPVWATLPGVGLLSMGLLVLPFRMVRAGGGGGGPSPGGSHGELFLAYLPDPLGTTKGVVDVFGNLEEARDYDPFGRSIAHTGDLSLKHRFTGQPQDEGDGLYDYGARLYNPEWGRFISPDAYVQSFDSQGINRYAYVRNQPTSRVDPTGNFGDAGGIGGSVGFSPGSMAFSSLGAPGGGGPVIWAGGGVLEFTVMLATGERAGVFDRLRRVFEALKEIKEYLEQHRRRLLLALLAGRTFSKGLKGDPPGRGRQDNPSSDPSKRIIVEQEEAGLLVLRIPAGVRTERPIVFEDVTGDLGIDVSVVDGEEASVALGTEQVDEALGKSTGQQRQVLRPSREEPASAIIKEPPQGSGRRTVRFSLGNAGPASVRVRIRLEQLPPPPDT